MAHDWKEPYGLPAQPRQISRRERWSERTKTLLTVLGELPPPVRLGLLLMLLVLVTLLAGCETLPSLPNELPRNPAPPPSKLAERSESWSTSVEHDLQKWRQMLMSPEAKPQN